MNVIYTTVLCFSLVAPAVADEALQLIPESSIVVARVRAPQQTINDLGDFADLIQPGVGAMIRPQLLQVARTFRLGSLAGVDVDKDWYVFLMAKEGSPPESVMLVPATDEDEVSEQVNPVMAVKTLAGYVAICPKQWPLDLIDGTIKPISSKLSKQAVAELNSGHLSVAVNAPALRVAMATTLEDAESGLDRAVDRIAAQVRAANPAMNTAGLEAFYRAVFRNGLQAFRDNDFMTFSVEVVGPEIQFRGLSQFASQSLSAAFLQSQPSSSFDALSLLPADQSAYAAVRVNFADYLDAVKPMIESILSTNEPYRQAFEKAARLMATTEYGDFVLAMDMDLEKPDGAMTMASIVHATPMEPMKQLMEMFVNLPPIEMDGIKVESRFEPEVATINGKPVGRFVTKQTLSPQFDPTGVQQAVQNRLYGKAGMTQYMLMEDDRLLQFVGGTVQNLKALAEGQPNENEPFLAARSKLHKSASVVLMADIPQGLKNLLVLTFSIQNLPVPITADQISELQIEPTLAGMSAKVVDRSVEMKAHLPAEAIRNIVQAVLTLQQQFVR